MGVGSGRLRVLHWGPLLALTVIGTISASTVMADMQWWPPNTPGGILNLLVYAVWNIGTLYNFFSAMYGGPGWVDFGWKPEKKEDQMYLQYCTFCEAYKAPRSHHCRKCQRCVMKMDHHCPWINNCVGHRNHMTFTCFLLYAPLGCIHSLCILIPAMYRAVHKQYYMFYGTGEPIVNLGIRDFIACMFAVGLAVGVIFAVGGLFCVQMRSIIKNESGIETWIKDKATFRDRDEDEDEEFVYPYYLGKWDNFRMVFHWKTRPELNGIWWPVREGCNQFTLTVEQIKQKKDKRDKSVMYRARSGFSGSLCACTHGCRVCCCPPCTDEPRIPLSPGDHILVSRWKKHWLYGDKVLDEARHRAGDDSKPKRVRGWFPRHCVEELIEPMEQQPPPPPPPPPPHRTQSGTDKKRN